MLRLGKLPSTIAVSVGSILAISLTLSTQATNVWAQQVQTGTEATITVVTGNRTGTIPVLTLAGEELVAVQAIATFLGGQLVTTSDPDTVKLRAAGREVELTANRNFVQLGGKLRLLASPVRSEGGLHYVPIDFLTKVAPALSSEPIRYDGRERLWVFGTQYPRISVSAERLPEYTRVVMESDRAVPFVVEESDDAVRVRIQTPYLVSDFRGERLMDGVVENISLSRESANYLLTVGLGNRFGTMKAYELPSPDRVVLDLIRSRVPTTDGSSIETDLRSMDERADDTGSDDSGDNVGIEDSDQDPTSGSPTLSNDGIVADNTDLPPMSDDTFDPSEAPRDPRALAPRDATKIRTVTLDPGHGGAESGATGGSGTTEKAVTLSISRKLQQLLQDRLGVRVFLTRSGDQNIGLEERAAAANSNKSDLFLSIHADASPRSSARGSSVYYQSHSAAEGVARAAQNSPRSDDLSFILWSMSQASHLNQSAQLAEILQEELYATTGHSGANRGIKQNSFIVLVGANMPAVLVEVGFISNPDEEELLSSTSYQDRLAESIYQGVLRYKRQFEGDSAGQSAGRDP